MKLAGPFGTGLRVTLYNVGAVLLILLATALIGIIFPKSYISPEWLGRVVEYGFATLMVVAMFPASLLFFVGIHTDRPNEVFLSHYIFPVVYLLNPLVWGITAYVVHKLVLKRKSI